MIQNKSDLFFSDVYWKFVSLTCCLIRFDSDSAVSNKNTSLNLISTVEQVQQGSKTRGALTLLCVFVWKSNPSFINHSENR